MYLQIETSLANIKGMHIYMRFILVIYEKNTKWLVWFPGKVMAGTSATLVPRKYHLSSLKKISIGAAGLTCSQLPTGRSTRQN